MASLTGGVGIRKCYKKVGDPLWVMHRYLSRGRKYKFLVGTYMSVVNREVGTEVTREPTFYLNRTLVLTSSHDCQMGMWE